MTNYTAIQARLNAKIAQAHQKKELARQPRDDSCLHEWKLFRKTVVPYRPDGDRVPAFLGNSAHFKIKACVRCKAKQYIDYVVER